MDKTYPLSSLIIVSSLDVKKDPFHYYEKCEELLCPKASYLNIIGAFMYLINCTRLNIAFLVNLLAIYNSSQTKEISTLGR